MFSVTLDVGEAKPAMPASWRQPSPLSKGVTPARAQFSAAQATTREKNQGRLTVFLAQNLVEFRCFYGGFCEEVLRSTSVTRFSSHLLFGGSSAGMKGRFCEAGLRFCETGPNF